MNIFGLLADHAGCGYYRIKLPLGELERHGHNVTVSNALARADAERADVIIGQRVVLKPISAIWQHIARGNGARLVYEVDDDLWNIAPDNPASKLFTPDAVARITRNVEVAHAVTVTTPELAERIRPMNPNVFVLPNYVDESVLAVEHADPGDVDPVRVGWQGSPTHERDFKQASPAIARLLRQSARAQFWTLGGNYLTKLEPGAKAQSDKIFVAPWINNDWPLYYQRVSDIHVGLAPLVSSTFNSSKSHIKALEYAALGIPCIVSDEPPYRRFVQHGETGFIIQREYEWFKYMRDLVYDNELRQRMSATAHEYAFKHTIQRNAWRWEEALSSVL